MILSASLSHQVLPCSEGVQTNEIVQVYDQQDDEVLKIIFKKKVSGPLNERSILKFIADEKQFHHIYP